MKTEYVDLRDGKDIKEGTTVEDLYNLISK